MPLDVIVATFNVINHLPDLAAVGSMINEVPRVLRPGGLFMFDLNTRRGLQATSETTERHDGPTDVTEWNRLWVDDSKLRLKASGTFFDGEVWHEYDETID